MVMDKSRSVLVLALLHGTHLASAFVPKTTLTPPTSFTRQQQPIITSAPELSPIDIWRVGDRQQPLGYRQVAEIYTECDLDCGEGSYCQVFDALHPNYGVCCSTGVTCTGRTACVGLASHTYGVTAIGSWGAVNEFSTMFCGINDQYCNTLVFQSALDSAGDDLTIANCFSENIGYTFISASATADITGEGSLATSEPGELGVHGGQHITNTELTIGAIVGIALGGLLILGAIGGGIAICLCFRRRKRRRLAAQQQPATAIPPQMNQNGPQNWNGTTAPMPTGTPNPHQPMYGSPPPQTQYQAAQQNQYNQTAPQNQYNQSAVPNQYYPSEVELETPIEHHQPTQTQLSDPYKPKLDARLSSYNTASSVSALSEMPGNPYYPSAAPPSYDAFGRAQQQQQQQQHPETSLSDHQHSIAEIGGHEVQRQPLLGNGFENAEMPPR